MKITYLPHAKRRMELREISEEEVESILEDPDLIYPGKLGRMVAERSPSSSARGGGRSLAVRVIYNQGLEEERIVVTVELGRPTSRRATPEGGERT